MTLSARAIAVQGAGYGARSVALHGLYAVASPVAPAETDFYRRVARQAVALRVTGNANPVMVAIGQRHRTR